MTRSLTGKVVLVTGAAKGIGAGIAFNPILLAAMSGVEPTQAGLASGVVNTSFMMGGAVGLAVLVSLADSRSDAQREAGIEELAALNSGYHLAFVVGAIFLVGAAALAGGMLRVAAPQPHGEAAFGAPVVEPD